VNRRALLSACALGAGTLLSTTAGCLARDESPLSDGGADEPSSAGDRRLEVVSVETPTDAVRLNDLGTSPGVAVPAIESLSDRKRQVVTTALDDRYETDAPADWLVSFLSETPYVRRDGVYYELDHTLPRYTITATETTADAVDGQIADDEAYREAVTHDGVVFSGLLRIARQEGFTTVDLWPSLREFLDTYEAVRYRGDLLTMSLSVDDGGPPYTVTGRRIAPTDLTDESVYDASEASDAVKEAVRAAGETRGVYAGDIPETLLDAVAAHQYVYLDGTFYWAGVENRGALPVDFEATVTQAEFSESSVPNLHLALVNRSKQDVSVFSGAPAPFGVLRLESVDDDGTVLLWTDAYRDNKHVGTDGKSVTMIQDIGLTTPLPAGERLERTFEVVDTPAPGEYVLRGNVGIEYPDSDDGGSLAYRVTVRVAEVAAGEN
jgi:hypothetical protein